MKNEDAGEVLAATARSVVDAETLKAWVRGPVRDVLPHAAMLCGQSVPHSGGYAAIQAWSFGVPAAYRARIACAGGNARSPVLTRLMRTGGPVFFDGAEESADFDPAWRSHFKHAGWRNLLGLAHLEGAADGRVLTAAAFYDVGPSAASNSRAIQRAVMPVIHAVLSRLYRAPRARADVLTVTPAERALLDLLLRGWTNKQIARQLGKSDETVKRQLTLLTLPRFHVHQEVDNFEGTENRNERRQAAEEAVHRGI